MLGSVVVVPGFPCILLSSIVVCFHIHLVVRCSLGFLWLLCFCSCCLFIVVISSLLFFYLRCCCRFLLFTVFCCSVHLLVCDFVVCCCVFSCCFVVVESSPFVLLCFSCIFLKSFDMLCCLFMVFLAQGLLASLLFLCGCRCLFCPSIRFCRCFVVVTFSLLVLFSCSGFFW